MKIIGRGLDVIDAYTPPGARYSLLAWTRRLLQHCPVGITNTATLASLTVRSPNRYGFAYGGLFTSGAFSPDGTRLAVFLNTTDPRDPSGSRSGAGHRQHQDRDAPAGPRGPPRDI